MLSDVSNQNLKKNLKDIWKCCKPFSSERRAVCCQRAVISITANSDACSIQECYIIGMHMEFQAEGKNK